MKASICIATHDKPEPLRRVLDSIYIQQPPFAFEVIVVDDGPSTVATAEVCRGYEWVHYIRRRWDNEYRNPAPARNAAYRRARGEIIICQSDDVVHRGEAIEQLVEEMAPGRFVLATVLNTDEMLRPKGCGHPRNPGLVELCGPKGRRPLFFLGAVYRSDLYAVGGNDERFIAPGREDVWFVDCLTKGRGLEPFFGSARGCHLHHERPPVEAFAPSHDVYRSVVVQGVWHTPSAPWPV